MNLRLTAGLAMIAGILGLLLLFWGREEDVARRHFDQARRAFRFDAARVDRLLVDSGDLRIECRRSGNQWQLVHPIEARADPVAIERLLGSLQELPRGDVILPPRRSANPLAPYGLEDPLARVELVEGIVTNHIHIGRRTPLGDGVYARQPDRPGLVRIRADLLGLLPTGVDALRDRSLLSGATASIERLDVRGPGGYVQLVRGPDGAWRLFQPFTARADSATVAALVEQLLACRVVHFIQDSVRDLAPYGLDNHGAVTALLNAPAGQGSQMLSFGDPLPNAPDLVYARLQAENSVYAVPMSVRQSLLVRPDDLRDRRIPGIDPAAIRRLRAEDRESVLELVRDDSDNWRITAPIHAPGNAEAIEQLLNACKDVRLCAFESPSSTNPPPDVRKMHIDLRNGRDSTVVLRLGPVSDDKTKARVEIEGDSTIGIASPACLLDFPLDPIRYRSLDVLSISPADVRGIEFVAGNRLVKAVRDPATGLWPANAEWIDPLLSALAPLRAESLLSLAGPTPGDGFESPSSTLSLLMNGQDGLSTTLLVGGEQSPGGSRRATLRGRDVVFVLSPATLQALTPPSSGNPE